ncbi:MAG: phycobiliprotein lyase [Pseudanabaenaceae cyanobacterium]
MAGLPTEFVPPMTMADFFRCSEGVWYSRRTVHHFDASADESGESNLTVIPLAATDERVQALCDRQGVDPQRCTGGAAFYWQDNRDRQPLDESRAAITADLPDPSDPQRGQLLRDRGYVEQIPVISRYWFGEGGVLTIDTEYETNQGQERCWFVSPQFRVRVGNVRTLGGIYLLSYCSERRCVPSPVRQ